MDKDLEKEIERRVAAQKAAREASPAAPLPESPSVYEGKPNARSNKTLEKLRGLTQNLSAQLAEVRNAHVIRITTLATELVDVQADQIKELEKEVERLDKRVRFYVAWEETREFTEVLQKLEQAEADREELAGRLEAIRADDRAKVSR